jgi:hypothetical protein
MEKRLVKAGRTEEYNKQFEDKVDSGVFRKLINEKMDAYRAPMNYFTMVEAFNNGLFVTTLLRICKNSSMIRHLHLG